MEQTAAELRLAEQKETIYFILSLILAYETGRAIPPR